MNAETKNPMADLLGDGFERYVPPPRATGWSDGKIKLATPPAPRDPELNKKLSVIDARRMIAELRTDLADAKRFGAAQLVARIETLMTNRASIFEKLEDESTPSNGVALDALAAATAALRAAEEVPCSLDRAAAIERENDIVHARNVVRVRELDVEKARYLSTAINSLLGDAYVWLTKKNSPRQIARGIVDRIVAAARRGTITDADVEQPCEEAARAWEALWMGRALEAYGPGDGLPVEALRVAFEARVNPDLARRKWLAASIADTTKKAKK